MSRPSSVENGAGLQATESAADPLHDRFALTIERHSPMVLGVCRRMLPGADAEDAAQAVFILFWQKAVHLKDETRIVGWLHRTAQYVCRNAQRSLASRSRHEQKVAAEVVPMTPDCVESAEWKEMRQILDQEVNRLPGKLRVAFVLFHCEHRPLAEVADLIGATVPTVSTWLRRAREKLASRLKKRGIMVGAAALGAMLATHPGGEQVSAAFVAATLQMVSRLPTAGLAACSPQVASLVKAGVAGGIAKSVSLTASIAAAAAFLWLGTLQLLPVIQTHRSPDFPLLQGRWREVASERDGGPVEAAPSVEHVSTLQITGRNFHRTQMLASGRMLKGESGSFVLDSSQSPAAIDVKASKGTARGIYELDEDTLTLCVTRDGGPRPDGFATSKNDDRILSRYKRER